MNPTHQSKLTGTVSVELGLKFERQLSEKEAEFWADVIETALTKYALTYLQNRVEPERAPPSETPEEDTVSAPSSRLMGALAPKATRL
jgi:hypothetical protein